MYQFRTTPDNKNQRQNTYIINTSQSPRANRGTVNRFAHPSDPVVSYQNMYPSTSKNSTLKGVPVLFESNQLVQQQRDSMPIRQVSKSPQNGKENQLAHMQTIKTIIPSPSRQQIHSLHSTQDYSSGNRVQTLEKQISAFLQENKQLTKVLDQQIQINQNLKEQLKQKQVEIQNLENQQQSSNKKDADSDLKPIIDQLHIYKQIVDSLEIKINNVIQENNKLNECLELANVENERLKGLLNSKPKTNQFTELSDTMRIKEENQLLRQNMDSMEQEMLEMRNQIEVFKQHIVSLKDTISPNNHKLLEKQVENKNSEISKLQQEISSLKQQLNNKDHQHAYLSQLMQLEAQKLKNAEEKLTILERENQLLKSMN